MRKDGTSRKKVGEWRGVIVVQYLSNDITVCSGFIFGKRNHDFFIFYYMNRI